MPTNTRTAILLPVLRLMKNALRHHGAVDVPGEVERRDGRVSALVEHNVRSGLTAQDAILGLAVETIDRLAWAITANAQYVFDIQWSPSWVQAGDFHTWEVNGWAVGRCPRCLCDSPPQTTQDLARAWVRHHLAGGIP
jgi:hypothetical protein